MISHFGAIQVRAVGSGNLRPTFYSLDSVRSQVLVPLVMSTTNERELFRLANFTTPKCMLKIETTAISESFKINKIIIYTKPVYTNYPG